MLNIEKYKDVIPNMKQANIACCVRSLIKGKCIANCKECKKEALEWLTEEYKEPILDEAEKEYLSSVIKPFRSRVVRICKRDCSVDNYYIKIILKPIDDDSRAEHIELPEFKKDVMMYKGMKADKRYSLEELGL